ncbi:hypothetical protein CSKR_110138 [Clonorchis sinensis]|uniref:Uncharacterized protein n=1 Tax=Clonorchis sinensis TaxID=79923 RepID=A0A3R7FQC3_CLOSI|nr:hypothetical protein CSKR_110138 [Clonorchis sinensis]
MQGNSSRLEPNDPTRQLKETNSLICKQIWFCERFTRKPAESLVCDVSRQLNVLHQTASCFTWCDIRDIMIHTKLTCDGLFMGQLHTILTKKAVQKTPICMCGCTGVKGIYINIFKMRKTMHLQCGFPFTRAYLKARTGDLTPEDLARLLDYWTARATIVFCLTTKV